MQEVLVATSNNSALEDATNAIPDKSLLYNQEANVLNIKYNNELHKVKADPDNDCIIDDSNLTLHLSDNIHMVTSDIDADNTGACPVKSFIIHENGTSSTKSILLLMKYSESPVYGMSGELFRRGSQICGAYHLSITSTGDCTVLGASTDESKAVGVKAIYNNNYYVGIKFNSKLSSHLYFHGFDTRTTNAMPPDPNDYRDSDLTIVE